MDWKPVLGGIGVFVTIVGVIAAFGNILEFFKWAGRPMLKKHYLSSNSWPFKLTLKYAVFLKAATNPSVDVELLVEPRKEAILGKCELAYPDTDLIYTPIPAPHDSKIQQWKYGSRLKLPRTYTLRFYMPENVTRVQILVESEGYICKSNIINIL